MISVELDKGIKTYVVLFITVNKSQEIIYLHKLCSAMITVCLLEDCL